MYLFYNSGPKNQNKYNKMKGARHRCAAGTADDGADSTQQHASPAGSGAPTTTALPVEPLLRPVPAGAQRVGSSLHRLAHRAAACSRRRTTTVVAPRTAGTTRCGRPET